MYKKTSIYLLFIFMVCKNGYEGEHYQTSVVRAKDTLNWPPGFQLGRLATSEDISTLDIDVRPDGVGLPAGSGNVFQGKSLYAQKCAECHGKTGTEGPFNPLVTRFSHGLVSNEKRRQPKTIGNYWPYATTLYDYINRAMPYDKPGTLTANEVYSLTAFLLHANSIIDSTIVIDARTLPKVVMPAQRLFVRDDRKGGPEVK